MNIIEEVLGSVVIVESKKSSKNCLQKVDERVLLNRRDWPVVHLREVLENMMKITPQNLISR